MLSRSSARAKDDTIADVNGFCSRRRGDAFFDTCFRVRRSPRGLISPSYPSRFNPVAAEAEIVLKPRPHAVAARMRIGQPDADARAAERVPLGRRSAAVASLSLQPLGGILRHAGLRR